MTAVVRTTLAAVATIVAAAACGGGSTRLPDGARSIDALVEEYMAAVSNGDTVAMHSLRLTEREHNELLWPELPASRPEFNMPIDYAWQNLDRNSRRGASRVAHDFRGRSLDPTDVVCKKGVTRYATLSVHGDCWITVRDERTHHSQEVKLFGSIVEMDGRFKIIGIVAE